MKKLFALMMCLLLAPLAFANDDSEATHKDSVTTSKNPITGSVTVTKKHARKKKHGKDMAKVQTTEKTTVKSDGEVDKSTTEESSSESGASK